MNKSLFGIIRFRDQLPLLIALACNMSRSIHSEEHLVFRKMLAAARKDAGLTQHEVARRIDRPQSFVAKYEGGERRVDVLEFIIIACALERDPVQLFTELVAKVQRSRNSGVEPS